MQTSYALTPAIAVPGMLRDESLANMVVSYPAGESIQFGRLCQLTTAGLLQQVQDTGSLVDASVVGVSIYQPAREQAYPPSFGGANYALGDMVPVLRRGRIFAEWNGTTQGYLARTGVNHSSTIATNRGVFTDAGLSAVAGSEVSPAPSGLILYAPTGLSNVCEVELNLPADSAPRVQGGTGTLVAGVLTVNTVVTVTANSAITVSRMVAAGTLGTDGLAVTAQTVGAPGTGAFTITSLNDNGTTGTTDTSTVAWVVVG